MQGNPTADPMIHLRCINKAYHRGQEQVNALKNVSMKIYKGEIAVVIGPSGGGKSTLLHLIGGIDRPTSGDIQICGEDLNKLDEMRLTNFRRDHIGFVFQFYNLLPSLTAAENTALPFIAQGMSRKDAEMQAMQLLARMGLDGRAKHKPGELSGGEQQRVTIARAIAISPELVLADEPTGDLDKKSAEDVIQLLLSINHQYGTTIAIVTHNDLLTRYAKRRFELNNGILHEIHPK